jgi:hypothetical protein
MTSTMRFDKWENSLGQPYGNVLQVVSATKSDTFVLTSTTMTNITGLAATITPFLSTSKILVIMTLGGVDASGSVIVSGDVIRNGTQVGVGDSAGSRLRTGWIGIPSGANRAQVSSFNFLDSPTSTSPLTYQARIRSHSGTVYVNRAWEDTDTTVYSRTISTITLLEIAQ